MAIKEKHPCRSCGAKINTSYQQKIGWICTKCYADNKVTRKLTKGQW